MDRLNDFADECYFVVDKIIDLDVTTSLTIKSVSEYIQETARALDKLNDDSLNLKQLKELNETYEAIIEEYNSQLKELVLKAVETKTGLKKMGNLQFEMFKIVTKEKKYQHQKDRQEYHEVTFLSGIWKFFRSDVKRREFEENLEILEKFEEDKEKAVYTIIEIEQSVDRYQKKLEKLRNKVGRILFARISTKDHIGLLLSFFGIKRFKSVEKE
ncbi:11441_t:CDS:2 [Diversispora eburnea]|uniref:11441_t:CDS:1 n=1 Tax=Diversispora eburnea TaxID=1213867 RepID=A0A9N9B0H7_9GLOM|nr:11441_t:CDS:2 [Diversispora eburnea]